MQCYTRKPRALDQVGDCGIGFRPVGGSYVVFARQWQGPQATEPPPGVPYGEKAWCEGQVSRGRPAGVTDHTSDGLKVGSPDLAWHKASASATGNCVEVSIDGQHVLVRDSKDPDGPVLRFTPSEWDCFLAGVRQGEFDRIRLLTRTRRWVRRRTRGSREPALA